MKKRNKQSIIGLIIMTLLLSILQVTPIFANEMPEMLKIGDYIKFGKNQGKDILWRVQEKNKQGTLIVREEDFEIPVVDDKVPVLRNLNQEQLPDIYRSFSIKEEAIIFKTGQGKKENPYTLYEEAKDIPDIVVNKEKVSINSTQLIGELEQGTVSFVIYLDGVPAVVQKMENDITNQKVVLTLKEAVRQEQVVSLQYDLPADAKMALSKVGEDKVFKKIPLTVIKNETVDIKETIITQPLSSKEIKSGLPVNFEVIASGEGNIIFNWYKNNVLISTETLSSAGVPVASRYNIENVSLGNAGGYKVVITGAGGEKITECELKVIANQYNISMAASPEKGGSVSDNSISGKGVYTENDTAVVTANPRSGYRFMGWTENGKTVSYDKSYSFKVTGNRNLIANFKKSEPYIPQYTIYVEESPTAGGTVRGDYTYNEGETATLRALPKEGYVFESWTEKGKVVSRSSEYSFTVKENRWLEANFEVEEVSFKERFNELSSKDKREIETNFKEYLPYTIIDETLSREELDELTTGKFTDEQLRELARDMELLEDVGIDLEWEVIRLKEVSRPSFNDIRSSHWAYDNIIALAKRGIVTGYPDQTFKPNNELTVADTFTFLDRVLLLNDVTKMDLSRSVVEDYIYYNTNNWAYNHVASVSSKLTRSTIKTVEALGNKSLSRGLLAQVLYEVTDGQLQQTEKLVVFTDTFNSRYEKAIDYCVTRGLLRGTSSDKMSPNKPVTRAEMMTILQRLDNLLD